MGYLKSEKQVGRVGVGSGGGGRVESAGWRNVNYVGVPGERGGPLRYWTGLNGGR